MTRIGRFRGLFRPFPVSLYFALLGEAILEGNSSVSQRKLKTKIRMEKYANVHSNFHRESRGKCVFASKSSALLVLVLYIRNFKRFPLKLDNFRPPKVVAATELMTYYEICVSASPLIPSTVKGSLC